MTTTTPQPSTVREPTAWLRTTARHRARSLARTANRAANRHPGATIVATLGIGQDLTEGSRDDRTCDRCKIHCPEHEPFGVALYVIKLNDTRVVLVVGLCDAHFRAEVPDVDTLNLPTTAQASPPRTGRR